MERIGLLTALRDTTFRSLRHPNYRRYFLGQIVSFTGTWMQSAALMWLLYDRTGDPRWPSWLLVAQVGPTLLLGPWGGGLADRVPRRRLVLATQSAFLVHAVVLTFLIAFDLAPPFLILGFMVVSGVIQAVDLPARLAFVPELVPREDLINAVGLNSLLFNSARALGPAMTGLIFLLAEAVLPAFPPGTSPVTVGAVACFSFNALSFLAVLLALRGIRVAERTGAKKTDAGSHWDGIRYLRAHPSLGGLVLLTLAVCVFGWPLITILPAYTDVRLGAAGKTYSVLVSAVGAGALCAALTTATFGRPDRRAYFLVAGTGVMALGLFAISQTTETAPAAAGCAAMGFGMILYLSTGQSTLQLAVPDEKRGRVLALWAMTLSASAPLGHLAAGIAVTAFGVDTVLLGMAGGVAATTTLLLGVVLRRKWGRETGRAA
jgi:MFS family permease